MIAVFDCNEWVEVVKTLGHLPNANELARTDLGRALNMCLKGHRDAAGVRLTLGISRHIIVTVDHILAEQGYCEPGAFAAWIRPVISRLHEVNAVIVDPTVENFVTLRLRAEQADGCRDATGRPDAEDEAVLRFVLACAGTLYTRESRENFPYYASRRGATVGSMRELLTTCRPPALG